MCNGAEPAARSIRGEKSRRWEKANGETNRPPSGGNALVRQKIRCAPSASALATATTFRSVFRPCENTLRLTKRRASGCVLPATRRSTIIRDARGRRRWSRSTALPIPSSKTPFAIAPCSTHRAPAGRRYRSETAEVVLADIFRRACGRLGAGGRFAALDQPAGRLDLTDVGDLVTPAGLQLPDPTVCHPAANR